MNVVHLQIENGNIITATDVKRYINFVESRDWLFDGEEEPRKADCLSATEQARRDGLFGYNASFVNCGIVTELVANMAEHKHEGRGIIVNTVLQTPSIFYVVDRLVRVPHLNFDFPDHTGFEFGVGALTLRYLTEEDKMLLRLANNPRKEVLEDGRTVERLVR